MQAILLLLAIFAHPTEAQADPNCSNAYDGTAYYDFKESCFKHDVCYSEAKLIGLSKKQCDDRFHSHLKASCHGRSYICDAAVKTYYMAVQAIPQNVFDAAAEKGKRILLEVSKMSSRDQRDAKAFFSRRAIAQEAWTAKNKECSTMSNDERFKVCRKAKNAINVPDHPDVFHIGKCNVLGIEWADGSRTANARQQAHKYGVPLKELTTRDGRDPCAKLY